MANWLNCVWHIAMYIKRAFMGGGLKLKLFVTNNYIINFIFHTLFGMLRIVLYICFRRGLHPREGRSENGMLFISCVHRLKQMGVSNMSNQSKYPRRDIIILQLPCTLQ